MAPRRLLVALLATASFVTLPFLINSSTTQAQTPDNAAIIGGWRSTGGPETEPEDFMVAVFHQGGTMMATGGDGDRSQGVWIRTGPRTFAFTADEFDIHNDGSLSRGRIRGTIVIPQGDRNTANATVTFEGMSPDGLTVVACCLNFSFQATRMLVVPE